MRTRHYFLFAVVCVIHVILFSPVRAEESQVLQTSGVKAKSSAEAVEVRDFEVRVDNRPVGTQRLTIRSGKDHEKVEFQTDVKVDVIVYSYIYKSRGSETWRSGRLDDHDMRCEDGGKKRSFTLKTEGGSQQAIFNGKSVPVSIRNVMTTCYWKLPSAELRAKPLRIVDVDKGTSRDTTLTLVGSESVPSGNRSITSQHFKVESPTPIDLWFDDQGRLVRQKSLEEGHWMELRLKQIHSETNEK